MTACPTAIIFEGGAGETIRRELLKQADVHTLLRLGTNRRANSRNPRIFTEEHHLADDVRTLSTLVHALRGAR